jgi:RNA polymerase sigma-70 factor (ECF subfamily)
MPFEDKTGRTGGMMQPLINCTDEQLVELLVAGNDDAMSAIFDRYYPIMMRVALRIVRDAGEAEDAVQIAFTDFYRNAKNFRPSKGRLSTWLLQYIYGRSINRRNGLKSRHHFDHLEFADVDLLQLVDRRDESLRLTSQEARVFVQQALGLLNEKQCRVVELICFVGLTIQEAATITGESKGNVQHHYYRGLEKLRKEFQNVQSQIHDESPRKNAKHRSWSLRKIDDSAKVLAGEVDNVKTQIL